MNQKNFSAMLRELRRQRFLSISELARRAGISKSHISMLEAGTRRPGLKIIGRLVTALELDEWERQGFIDQGMTASYETGQSERAQVAAPRPENWQELMSVMLNVPVSPEERAALGRILRPSGA